MEFPSDTRYEVVGGDCNTHLAAGLRTVADLQWAPTFAFIDPKGLDVSWTTLEQLSRWRRERKGRKTELWMLLPEPALSRVLGLQGVRGQSSADLLSNLYGSDDWIAIHQRRRSGDLSPDQARAEFVNLLRWRMERVLGYRTTHALQLHNVSNQPVYTMVFATDAEVGDAIMRDIYDHAMVHEIPTLRAHALSARQTKREQERGLTRLFDPGAPLLPSSRYEYTTPWEPPQPLDVPLELDAEPPPESDSP